LPVLSALHAYQVVEQPKAPEKQQTSSVPDFEVIGVDGPEDDNWSRFPEDISDSEIASCAIMDSGKLLIYYSKVYPKFSAELRALEAKDPALANTFQKRYEVWLALHSLMYYQDQKLAEDKGDVPDLEDSTAVRLEHSERARLAVLASLMAKREVQGALPSLDDDDS
jgi:hypothetical protein